MFILKIHQQKVNRDEDEQILYLKYTGTTDSTQSSLWPWKKPVPVRTVAVL